jgi:hypothetical protein
MRQPDTHDHSLSSVSSLEQQVQLVMMNSATASIPDLPQNGACLQMRSELSRADIRKSARPARNQIGSKFAANEDKGVAA